MLALWRLILSWFARSPGSITDIRITDMATIRTITWQLPPVSSRQRPLSRTVVEYRVKSDTTPLPWTVQDEVSASGEQKLVINDPAPGTFEYRLTAVDIDGKQGPATIAEKSSDYDVPGAIAAVAIVDATA